MKTWKLVSGILSIVLCLIVGFQSCAAGISNSIQANGEVSGSAGVIVAIMILCGGIISIAARNSVGKGADIATAIIYLIGALFGFTMAGSYSDLRIWAFWCLICAVLAVVSAVGKKKESQN